LIEDDGTPLLSDFGLSRIRHEVIRAQTLLPATIGHAHVVAPELGKHLASNAQGPDGIPLWALTTEASDVFSLAMMFWNLWKCKPPFPDFSSEAAIQKVCEGQRPERPDRNVGILADRMELFWKLIQRMWAQEANERPAAAAVLVELEQIFGDLTVTLRQVPCP